MPVKLFYLNLTLLWIIIPARVTGSYPLCSTSEAVEGRRSEIDCYFNGNVPLTRTKFDVFRYDSWHKKELVLACHWLESGDIPECVARSGYLFDPYALYTTSSQTVATITIPYTSIGHAGNYYCQSSQHDETTSSYNCSLPVVGSRNSCTAGRVTEGERSTIVCHFNQDLHVTKGSFAVRKIREDKVYETVLACNWGKHHGHHVCAHNTGYTVTSDITHSVAVSIPTTGVQHDGLYCCITVPENRWVTSESCRLEVTPAVKESATSNTSPTSSQVFTPTDTGSMRSNSAFSLLIAASVCAEVIILLI